MNAEQATLVVPCYNEDKRLDDAAFLALLDDRTSLLFVNDGSTDATEARLRALAARDDRIGVISFPKNLGKAEAVRIGLQRAHERHMAIVGYVDADLATPAREISRLLERFRSTDAALLLGSRVALLGREISRSPHRHYLGRVFASTASLLLRLRVYDTQCGAKLFRVGPALRAALEEPFVSRWIFDVELLGRLTIGAPGAPPVDVAAMIEEPLWVWRDMTGSKLRSREMLGAATDLVRVAADLARRRRLQQRSGQ
jgi:glycosyltransferase involved in cell wall biosynthesis